MRQIIWPKLLVCTPGEKSRLPGFPQDTRFGKKFNTGSARTIELQR